MTRVMGEAVGLPRWQCLLLAVALATFGIGGTMGVYGQLGQDLAITILVVVVLGGFLAFVRRLIPFLRSGGVARLYEAWSHGREPVLEATSFRARADLLAKDLDRAQELEDDAARRFGVAQCAAEDVIRAKAIRLQAEIALMRHRMTELQYSYCR